MVPIRNIIDNSESRDDSGKSTSSIYKRWSIARPIKSLRSIVHESTRAIAYIRAMGIPFRSYRLRIVLLVLLSLIMSVPSLITPLLMRTMIDKVYPARDFDMFWLVCGAIIAIRLIRGLAGIAYGYLLTYVRSMVGYRLSLRVFQRLQRLDLPAVEERKLGEFLERASSDVRLISDGVARIVSQFSAIIFTLVAAIYIMYRLTPSLTMLILAVIPVNYCFTAILARKLRHLRFVSQAFSEQMTSFIAETVKGASIAQLFGFTRHRRIQFKKLLRDRLHVVFATWRVSAFWGQLSTGLSTAWGLILLSGGWYLVLSGRLLLGEVVALGMYIVLVARPFHQLADIYKSLMVSSVSAQRVLEILKDVPLFSRRSGYIIDRPIRRLELQKLGFAYGEQAPCLRQVDLCVKAGETIAIIGPTGSGKSTMLRLLAGLDSRYSGQICIDGHDIREIAWDSYQHLVALVSEKHFFFTDSIIRNLLPNATQADVNNVRQYAKALGVDKCLTSMPKGYDTIIGEGGIRLSSGQYQKLAVLRAILKAPSILLLDEMTSCLDKESEQHLFTGVSQHKPDGCIMLLITHRLELTKKPCIDRIVVLVDGKIAETGPSKELYERRGLYYQWLNMNKTSPPLGDFMDQSEAISIRTQI